MKYRNFEFGFIKTHSRPCHLKVQVIDKEMLPKFESWLMYWSGHKFLSLSMSRLSENYKKCYFWYSVRRRRRWWWMNKKFSLFRRMICRFIQPKIIRSVRFFDPNFNSLVQPLYLLGVFRQSIPESSTSRYNLGATSKCPLPLLVNEPTFSRKPSESEICHSDQCLRDFVSLIFLVVD